MYALLDQHAVGLTEEEKIRRNSRGSKGFSTKGLVAEKDTPARGKLTTDRSILFIHE